MKIVILIHKGNGPESISPQHTLINVTKVFFPIMIQRRRNKVDQPDYGDQPRFFKSTN